MQINETIHTITKDWIHHLVQRLWTTFTENLSLKLELEENLYNSTLKKIGLDNRVVPFFEVVLFHIRWAKFVSLFLFKKKIKCLMNGIIFIALHLLRPTCKTQGLEHASYGFESLRGAKSLWQEKPFTCISRGGVTSDLQFGYCQLWHTGFWLG